mgnify:FL=1
MEKVCNLTSLSRYSSSTFSDCVFDIKSPNTPIVLDSDLNFVTSYTQDTIHFTAGEHFYLKCPSGTTSTIISETIALVVCIGGVRFYHTGLGKELFFDKLGCKDVQPAHALRQLDQPCANNFTTIQLGIEVNYTFIPEFLVCFDTVHLVPFYAEFSKTSYDCHVEDACDDKYNYFVDAGDLYGVDLDLLYQEAGDILQDLAPFNISYTQLVPKRYFLNPAQWYPTFDYVNFVFSWVPYSWFSPYSFCTNYLEVGSVIYNGVLGVSANKNDEGEYVNLYLFNGTVPIPKWYWCVFYDVAPEVDGRFYIDFGTPYSSIPEAELKDWWNTELCIADIFDYIEDGTFFYGNCTFEEVINPQLQNFIDFKWPGARTVPTTTTTPS